MTDTCCSFCSLIGPKHRTRVFGPMGVAICAECIAALLLSASGGEVTAPIPSVDVRQEWLVAVDEGLGVGERPPLAAVDGCSFCGTASEGLEHLFGSTDGSSRICDRCVRMASEMIAEEDGDLRS
jgi:hypothetical protein